MEDGDVILIAPTDNNQDGSQTFYILDPCPSSEDTDEPPEIKLIDMTAEVKNTGAIAVVSTNSNTGALEITLTNQDDKLKVEAMDPKENVVIEELNDSSSDPHKQECVKSNPGEKFSVKLEEELEEVEEGDVSQHSIHDCIETSVTEQKSESDSLTYEVIEQSHQIDMEQEDEVEEGTLYIDDNNDCEIQEEISQDIIEVEEIENLPPSSDRKAKNVVIHDKVESAVLQDEVAMEQTVFKNTDDEIAIKEASMKHIKTSVKEAVQEKLHENINNSPEEKDKFSNNQELQTQQNSARLEESEIKDCGDCVAIIHGHVIKIPCNTVCTAKESSASESVDNTNTALTLLELAGGSSYRNSVEQSNVEMEIMQLEEFDPSHSQTTCTDSEPAPELTTLTPLQPVPLEHSLENSLCNEEVISETMPETKSESPTTSIQARKVKVSTELVQRLLEREESSNRPQYKHLPRPSVSKSEIAQEIYERARIKYPYSEESGRDVIFAMKIAHRLASKIVSPEKSNEIPDKNNTEFQSLSTVNSFSTPLSRKDLISKYNDESKIQPKKRDAISDKIELLKILEDDPDDPESDLYQSPILSEKKPKIKISRPRAPLLKLHPELEKELALKQLQNFAPAKKKVGFVPEALKKIDVQGRGRPRKNHEHNNNSQHNLAKRKIDNLSTRSLKKLKNEVVESNAATVDPSQITETLTVEGQDVVEEQLKDGKSIKQYSNKRLLRNSETPPREVPMEILLNGIEDEGDLEMKQNLSKNKIFKATNTRKRQEELKKKHFANMLQRNKPQKKRGRPPKKKPLPSDDMLNKEFLMKVINEQSKPDTNDRKDSKNTDVNKDTISSTVEDKPFKTKKLREIERLLGDEGAINMLYSVEQKRKPGGEPKSGVLPYRKKKKDLMLKTKLVKSAVLRLSASPVQTIGRISLRGQGMKDGEGEQQNDEISLRKMSVDSRDSHQSLSSPPTETFSFPAKIVPAEASRIIRRHSSSSNYSSRSNSPRRLSVDGERLNMGSPLEISVTEIGQSDASVSNVSRSSKHPIPSLQSNGEVSKKAENSNHLLTEQSIKNSSEKHFYQPKTSVDSKKTGARTSASAKLKPQLVVEQNIKRPGRPRKKISLEEEKKCLELSTTLAAAIDEFTKESDKDKNIPGKTPKMIRSPDGRSTSKVAVYSKRVHGNALKRLGSRAIVYHELALNRQNHVVEVTLDPVSSTIKNALNIDVMRELIAVLSGLIKDENCRVVLLKSAGNIFCQGVDFPALVQPTSEQRMTAAQDMALAIKELVKMMAIFPKPIIAAVQGPAVGLGTTLLPLCDLVLASSEATFHTPYASLGQVPEGAATLTLPSLLGYAPASELLFVSRKLTAVEAQKLGLVTRIISTETFEQDLMSVVTTIASQSVQAMSATKALLRHSLLTSLETTLVSETHLLTQHWSSEECQTIFTKYLEGKGEGNPSFIFTQP